MQRLQRRVDARLAAGVDLADRRPQRLRWKQQEAFVETALVLGEDEGAEILDQGAQACLDRGVGMARQAGVLDLEKARLDPFHEREEQRLLAADMVVQRRLADAHGIGDLAERGRLVALAGEQSQRRVVDAIGGGHAGRAGHLGILTRPRPCGPCSCL